MPPKACGGAWQKHLLVLRSLKPPRAQRHLHCTQQLQFQIAIFFRDDLLLGPALSEATSWLFDICCTKGHVKTLEIAAKSRRKRLRTTTKWFRLTDADLGIASGTWNKAKLGLRPMLLTCQLPRHVAAQLLSPYTICLPKGLELKNKYLDKMLKLWKKLCKINTRLKITLIDIKKVQTTALGLRTSAASTRPCRSELKRCRSARKLSVCGCCRMTTHPPTTTGWMVGWSMFRYKNHQKPSKKVYVVHGSAMGGYEVLTELKDPCLT